MPLSHPHTQIHELTWGTTQSPLGNIFVATSPIGIHCLSFFQNSDIHPSESLMKKFPTSTIRQHNTTAKNISSLIFHGQATTSHLHLAPHGTLFQISVWNQLLSIPYGHTTTYSEIARKLGQPGASRAVGNAVGKNPIAILIPCHRVIRHDGQLGGYRWGSELKKTILEGEQLNPLVLAVS